MKVSYSWIWFFGLMIAAWNSWGLAQDSVVYISDTESGAVFSKNLSEDSTVPMNLVSGNTAVAFDAGRILSATEGIYSREGKLNLLQFENGVSQEIYSAPEGNNIVGLDTGPGENTISVLVEYSPSGYHVAMGTRPTLDGSWTFSETDLNFINKKGPFLPGCAFVYLGDGKYAFNLVEYYDPFGYDTTLFLTSVGTGTSKNILSTAYRPFTKLSRNDDGRWIVLPFKDNEFPIYDTNGSLLDTISYLENDLLRYLSSDVDWQNDTPAVFGATPTALLSGNDLQEVPFVPQQAFSFLDSNGFIDPGREFGGAEDILRTSDTSWNAVSWLRQSFVTANATQNTVKPIVAVNRGNGPSFTDMRDITVAPSGLVYVLDGDYPPLRIIEVNPLSGDRRIIANLDEASYFKLFINKQGDFLTVGENCCQNTDIGISSFTKVSLVQLTTDPYHPIITPFGTYKNNSILLDFAMDSQDRLWGIVFQNEFFKLLLATSGVISPTRVFHYFGTSPAGTTKEVEVEVEYPSQHVPQDFKKFIIYFSGNGGAHSFVATAPSGEEIPVNNFTTSSFTRNMPGNYHDETRIDVSNVNQRSGIWRFRFTKYSASTEIQIGMVAMPIPHARLLGMGKYNALYTYQKLPAVISKINLDTYDYVNPISLYPAPGSGVTGREIQEVSNLEIIENETSALLALEYAPKILKADLETGAVSLWIDGRPPLFDHDSLGLDPASGFHFAIGPEYIPAGFDANDWLKY